MDKEKREELIRITTAVRKLVEEGYAVEVWDSLLLIPELPLWDTDIVDREGRYIAGVIYHTWLHGADITDIQNDIQDTIGNVAFELIEVYRTE